MDSKWFKHAKSIVVIFLLFIIVDALYLYLVSDYFNTIMHKIQFKPSNFDVIAYFAVYIVLSMLFYIFIVKQNHKATMAFVLGTFTYLIYELTNKTVFDRWEWLLVLIDGLWGGILFFIIKKLYNQIYKYI